jgi:hypothetical protein
VEVSVHSSPQNWKKRERTKRKRKLATRASLKESGGINPFFGRQTSNFWLSITWMENPRCQYVLLCAPRKMNLEGGTAWKTT